MKTSDKDLKQHWTVTCSKEPGYNEWYARAEVDGTKAVATAKFKELGWRIINGRWFCPTCVASKTRKK